VIELKSLTNITFALMLINAFSISGVASGGTITYVQPTNAPNSNVNWPGGTNFSNNIGIAFTTGSSGPFDIDWVNLELNTSTSTAGSASLTVALRDTTISIADNAAIAGSTEYARDTVNFTKPTTTSTAFPLNLTSAQLTNITSYSLASSTSYALILYAPTVSIGMGRTTGFLENTTNNQYTVTNGFTMLNTFRNNLTYKNTLTSFPTVGISFGATTADPSAVPEPSTLGLGALVAASGLLRRFRKRFRRG
jgi:hypothetical protein